MEVGRFGKRFQVSVSHDDILEIHISARELLPNNLKHAYLSTRIKPQTLRETRWSDGSLESIKGKTAH